MMKGRKKKHKNVSALSIKSIATTKKKKKNRKEKRKEKRKKKEEKKKKTIQSQLRLLTLFWVSE